MHLIQLLLPLYDNAGNPFRPEEFEQVRDELAELFGGITTYVRSPAKGLWKETTTRTVHDDIVIYEVMVGKLDRQWWRDYRLLLEERFQQEVLIVRASEIDLL